MPHRSNFLLGLLEPADFDLIAPHLSVAILRQEQVLAETHQRIETAYFPHAGIISCVVELVGGGAIETGMIGRDGQFGAGPSLDHKISLNFVVMQVAGEESVVQADRVRHLSMEVSFLCQTAPCY